MTVTAPRLEELTNLWHSEIPISAGMSIHAVGYDGDSLAVTAPLSKNYNVHGTAFAGSQYAIASLAGWGLVYLILEDAEVDGSIVIADGQIRYAKPVAEDLSIVCRAKPEEADRFIAELRERGKSRLDLEAEVSLDDGTIASTFGGTYAVRVVG